MGAFSRIFYGIDLDEEQKRQDDLDSQLAALNRKALEDGKYTPEEFARAEQNRVASYIPDVSAQVGDAFEEGLQEGAQNEQAIIKKGLNTIVGTPLLAILGGIPFWFFILGAVVIFLFFGGGLALLRKKA